VLQKGLSMKKGLLMFTLLATALSGAAHAERGD
jgi:hypothetical protein